MLPFLRITKLSALGMILVLTVCAGVWYWLLPSKNNQPFARQQTEVIKQDISIKISPQTDILQRIVYTKCNDEESFRTKPADNLINFNYQQFQNVYSGWNIQKFDTLAVEMTLKVDSLCREHANNQFIGVKDGYVAVFYGKPSNKPLLKEVTKIPVAKLLAEDEAELKRGMIVQSREELLLFIEGLESR